MLDFEEELKKFQPSLEVEELGDAIYQDDLTDMTDLFKRSDRTDEAGRSTVNCGKRKAVTVHRKEFRNGKSQRCTNSNGNIEGSIWIIQQNWRISRTTGIMTGLKERTSGI